MDNSIPTKYRLVYNIAINYFIMKSFENDICGGGNELPPSTNLCTSLLYVIMRSLKNDMCKRL